MSELRWILIGFGIVLLAGIYLWGRRGSRNAASDEAVPRVRPEPLLQPRDPAAARDDTLPAPEDEHIAPAGRSDGRVEPTFDDGPGESRHEGDHAIDVTQTAELPDRADPAPTLSSSESPPVRRIERRKILSLRLTAAPSRFDGAKLLESLQGEALEHGKYSVFHRLHSDGASVFSVASMVEPGTFDPEQMAETQYPGITLFAQLPGPVPGMHALNELVACARRLQQGLGGTLQDDRGVPLTVHRIERLRQEVREFERPAAGAGGGHGSPAAPTLDS